MRILLACLLFGLMNNHDGLAAAGRIQGTPDLASTHLPHAPTSAGGAARGLLQQEVLNPPRVMNITFDGFLTPPHELSLGLLMKGELSRLRSALGRLRSQGTLKIAGVGGSVTAGQGKHEALSWLEWLSLWARQHYNGTGRVAVVNSAVPGTVSSYMSLCLNLHVPQDVDVVVIDYALNDEVPQTEQLYNNRVRRGFERLLRQLLAYPNRPAVILLNAYRWFQRNAAPDGTYWTGADREFQEMAAYYQLPVLSVKSCCWRLMSAGVPGFRVNRTRSVRGKKEPPEIDDQLKRDVFYFDEVHPNGWTGHKVMAELVIHLLLFGEKSIRRRPPDAAEERRRLAPLPPPVIAGNQESSGSRCMIEDALRAAVVPHPPDDPTPTFQWLNDRPPGLLQKYGLVSTIPRAVVRLAVDTRSPADGTLHQTSGDQPTQTRADTQEPTSGPPDTTSGRLSLVALAFLTSYEGMGSATVSCLSGCTCQAQHFEFKRRDRVSLTQLFELLTTQHEQCVIEVRTAGITHGKNESESVTQVGQKVKLSGLMVSDEDPAIASGTLKTFRAMDFVIHAGRKPGP